jgi:hypothetical protein
MDDTGRSETEPASAIGDQEALDQPANLEPACKAAEDNVIYSQIGSGGDFAPNLEFCTSSHEG